MFLLGLIVRAEKVLSYSQEAIRITNLSKHIFLHLFFFMAAKINDIGF